MSLATSPCKLSATSVLTSVAAYVVSRRYNPPPASAELKAMVDNERDLQVLDVRRPPEYESGHVPTALTGPLANLNHLLPTLNLRPTLKTAVICAGGYRSSAATSIMQQHGFTNLFNVIGGTGAWINAGYEVEMPPEVAVS